MRFDQPAKAAAVAREQRHQLAEGILLNVFRDDGKSIGERSAVRAADSTVSRAAIRISAALRSSIASKCGAIPPPSGKRPSSDWQKLWMVWIFKTAGDVEDAGEQLPRQVELSVVGRPVEKIGDLFAHVPVRLRRPLSEALIDRAAPFPPPPPA